MPEGPEVKVLANKLNKLLAGSVINKITVNSMFKDFYKKIKSNVLPLLKKTNIKIIIDSVDCKGKFLYFKLCLYLNNTLKGVNYILNHLGLSGHWILDEVNNPMVHISVTNNNNNENTENNNAIKNIYYTGGFVKGNFYWCTPSELKLKLKSIGPSILEKEFTESYFTQVMSNKKIAKHQICVTLLDQSLFSGIGNYLRADILYDCKIYPFDKVKDINNEKLHDLYVSIIKISKQSYNLNGSTAYKSLNTDNKYNPVIYNKIMDPLGNSVVALADSKNRTMFYVPDIQK